jgi:heme A synthase
LAATTTTTTLLVGVATTTTTTTTAHKSPPAKKKKNKLWLWLAGAGLAAVSAALSIPLIVDAAKKQPPKAPPAPVAHPAAGGPCAPAKYSSDASQEDESYKMGKEFGRAHAYTIMFSFAAFLVVVSFALARYRRARNARSTATLLPTRSDSRSMTMETFEEGGRDQEGRLLEDAVE